MIAVYAAPCPPDPPYLLYKQPYPRSRQHLQVEKIETNHSALYNGIFWSQSDLIRFDSDQIKYRTRARGLDKSITSTVLT